MNVVPVTLVDVTLRDGIQSESRLLGFRDRLQLISELIAAGITELQIGSFVHPGKVPQMAGIEELVAGLTEFNKVRYSALVLNAQGLTRLLATPLKAVDFSLSASDAHGLKNTGRTVAEALAEHKTMLARSAERGLLSRVGIQCAFGCPYSGAVNVALVQEMVAALTEAGAHSICLADSAGLAIPEQVTDLVRRVREVSALPINLHLHDTRGLGIANLLAGYHAGVRSFDVALGGLGGCPYIPGAGGNIASEDAVYLFDRMGVRTNVALARLWPLSVRLEGLLGRTLPSPALRIARHQDEQARHLKAPSINPNASTNGGKGGMNLH